MYCAQFLGMESILITLAPMGHSLMGHPPNTALPHQKRDCPPADDPQGTMVSAKRRDSGQSRVPCPLRCIGDASGGWRGEVGWHGQCPATVPVEVHPFLSG